MRVTRLVCFLAVLALFCLACQGQDSAAIKGNWHLTGPMGPSMGTQLALSIGMRGDTVLAMGNLSMQCPPNVSVGSTFGLRGQIAADGTFVLAGSDLTINGTVPGPGSGQWPGHFEFTTKTSKGECSKAGDFVATKLPPLKGVYSGTLQLIDQSGEVTVTVDLNQGELLGDARFHWWIPLQARMTLSGSSEFPFSKELVAANLPTEKHSIDEFDLAEVKHELEEGTFAMGAGLTGELFVLVFPTENGDRIHLGGWLMDTREQRLQVNLSNESSKKRAFGTLTRQ